MRLFGQGHYEILCELRVLPRQRGCLCTRPSPAPTSRVSRNPDSLFTFEHRVASRRFALRRVASVFVSRTPILPATRETRCCLRKRPGTRFIRWREGCRRATRIDPNGVFFQRSGDDAPASGQLTLTGESFVVACAPLCQACLERPVFSFLVFPLPSRR